ncbi:MAG: hypothetical protein GDA49_13025 [Rhodospirillales bacterium]|nr:hypothetical protein [Rhodospirillales bacterium]
MQEMVRVFLDGIEVVDRGGPWQDSVCDFALTFHAAARCHHLSCGNFGEVSAVADHITDVDPDTEFNFGLDVTLRGLQAIGT